MPEHIDSEQAKIAELEKKSDKDEKSKDLAAALKQNHETFFSAVDSAQENLKEGQTALQDKVNINALNTFGDDIQTYLQQVAAKGEYIFQSKDPRGVETIPSKAKSINERVGEIKESLPAMKACEYALHQEQAARKEYLDFAQRIKDTGELNGEKLTPEKQQELVVVTVDKAIDELAAAKRQLVLNSSVPGMLAEYYSQTLDTVDASLKDAAKIKLYYEAEDFTKKKEYKKYFIFLEGTGEVKVTDEFKQLPEDEQSRLLLELHGLKKKVADDIDEKSANSDEERGFYNAKKKMQEGELAFAKKDFLTYLKYLEAKGTKLPEEQARLTECKECLKQMALLELSMARKKLDLMRTSIEGRFAQVTNPGVLDVGVQYSQAKIYMDQMSRILDLAERRIESGEAFSIEEVNDQLHAIDPNSIDPHYEDDKFALKSFQKGFTSGDEQHPIFDVLGVQCDLSKETDPKKREEKILAYAKQAYALGLPDLARQYYDLYFQKEISEKAKEINREEFVQKMRQDSDLQEQLNQRMESLKPRVVEQLKKNWDHKYYPDGITAARQKELADQGITFDGEVEKIMGTEREKGFNMLADQAYMKAVKTAVHHGFEVSDMERMGLGAGVESGLYPPGSKAYRAYQWNEVYGNTFVNLDTYDKHWYQFWKFSDEEWNSFKTMVWIDIGTLIATGGIGTGFSDVAARALVGEAVFSRLLTKGVSEFVIHEALGKGKLYFALLAIKELGLKESVKYGIGHLLVDSTTTYLIKGSINEIIGGDNNIFTSPEKFFGRWGKSVLFSGAGKLPLVASSFIPTVKMLGGRFVDSVAGLSSSQQSTLLNSIALRMLGGEKLTEETLLKAFSEGIVF